MCNLFTEKNKSSVHYRNPQLDTMAVNNKKNCVVEISDYLDLAMNHKLGKKDSEDKEIPRIHSWSLTASEYNGVRTEGSRVHQVLEFKEVSSKIVQKSLSTRTQVISNPLVSMDTAGMTEDHQDVKEDVLELASRVGQSSVEKQKMLKVCDSDTPKFSSVTNMNNKRNSVVFQLFEDSQDCPSHSHLVARGPRPSIFSVFSQLSSRSYRSSIFSSVSLSQYYTRNHKKIGIFIMICTLVCLIHIVVWFAAGWLI